MGIKELATVLLKDYKEKGTYGRPVLDPAVHIRINISVHLMQIINLDEQDQVLTATMESDYVSNRSVTNAIIVIDILVL